MFVFFLVDMLAHRSSCFCIRMVEKSNRAIYSFVTSNETALKHFIVLNFKKQLKNTSVNQILNKNSFKTLQCIKFQVISDRTEALHALPLKFCASGSYAWREGMHFFTGSRVSHL